MIYGYILCVLYFLCIFCLSITMFYLRIMYCVCLGRVLIYNVPSLFGLHAYTLCSMIDVHIYSLLLLALCAYTLCGMSALCTYTHGLLRKFDLLVYILCYVYIYFMYVGILCLCPQTVYSMFGMCVRVCCLRCLLTSVHEYVSLMYCKSSLWLLLFLHSRLLRITVFIVPRVSSALMFLRQLYIGHYY